MIRYTNEQLASVIAIPIVTILLVWTTAIFQKNRKNWGPYDIPIVSILVLSIIRNLTILTYTLFVTLSQNTIDIDYCSGIIWIFNSIHTFQASALTTLAVIGLFSVRLHRKQQQIRQFLTATHVIYHLFCLTTLCACVGVAAILAQTNRGLNPRHDSNPCKFMPFDLDIKFNVFIIVLNTFLAGVSLIAFIGICVNHYKIKTKGFDYLKKSNSDLSDLSLGNDKHFYDTYTIHEQNYIVWNSDISNISTTVSSTNSRRPCLVQQQQHQQLKKNLQNEEENRTGLETIHPVLIVCYLFYHLPLIIMCIHPNLVKPWPVAGVALWLGLVQDILIPIGLSIVDSRFCKWVSGVYKCSDRHGSDKLPHVGLDGKFRPFGSQPQSLEINQNHPQVRGLQTVEHRFPITNGSLYTSIDGRLPVIHNYRRNKEQRVLRQVPQEIHINQPSHLRRPNLFEHSSSCGNCETDLCPSHSNLHHLSSTNLRNPRLSLSQENVMKNSRNLVRLNRMRLCKSEDSIDELGRDLPQASSSESLTSQSSYSITTEANCDFEFFPNKDQFNNLKPELKITRSNSKRSLESFHAFVETELPKLGVQRSNSYMTLADRRGMKNKKLMRSNSKLSDCTHNIRQKIKSVEYLPNNNASTVFIEDVYYQYPHCRNGVQNYVGSVPDLKKVFISEYI